MSSLRPGVAFMLCLVAVDRSAAQTPAQLEAQENLIVQVVPAKGSAGSGLIVAVEPGVVRILTARHVLETGVVLPATGIKKPEMSARRQCSGANMPFKVTFRFAQNEQPVEATSAYCSDAIDAAVIEVRKPSAFDEAIRPFSPQRPLSDQPGYQVYLAGLAQGKNWTHLSGAVASKSLDNIQVKGIGIGPGFSGGAVVDTELGFIGMIVRAGDSLVNSIPAQQINELLVAWNVRTTHLGGAPSQPENPRFAIAASPGFREENARNAIRRYTGAFVNMEAALLKKGYPNIGNEPFKLFGDSTGVKLVLDNCTDIVLKATPPVLTIKCAYELDITRKTGPPFHASSCEYLAPGANKPACPADNKACSPGRIAFTLASAGRADDPFEWNITGVTVDAAACVRDNKQP